MCGSPVTPFLLASPSFRAKGTGGDEVAWLATVDVCTNLELAVALGRGKPGPTYLHGFFC